MDGRTSGARRRACGGFSAIELTVVCAIIMVVGVIAIPQFVGARRAMRSAAIPREVKAQLRFARQAAMSQQRAITFQYKTDERRINIIQHNLDYAIPGGTTKVGTPVLNDPAYPMTAQAVVLRTVSLVATGTDPEEIVYGRPSGVPTANLADTTSLTMPVNNQINITFQPEGAVIDASGSPANFALMFYNSKHPEMTVKAVSILGAAGRIKIWRYAHDTYSFVE